MKINFFEEFPTRENLEKARLIDFETVIYIAAKNLEEFGEYARKVKEINEKVTPAYWPVLEKGEGYWMSPFSDTKALERIINELNGVKEPLKILWDCELPLKKWQIGTRIFSFYKNRKKIRGFIKNHPSNLEIHTAENVFYSGLVHQVMEKMGLTFDPAIYPHKRIAMFYTSNKPRMLFETVVYQIETYQKRYHDLAAGLGTISVGIHGNEPILSSVDLANDFSAVRKAGVKEVVIFRLGGLNKSYMEVINKFK